MSETDLAEVWARSLDELATMQIEPHQRAWLKLTRPLGLVENTALIATPNEFVKEQLETRLRALITHALSRELGRSIQLAVTVDPTAITAAAAFPAAPDPGLAARTARMATAGCRGPMGVPQDGRVPGPRIRWTTAIPCGGAPGLGHRGLGRRRRGRADRATRPAAPGSPAGRILARGPAGGAPLGGPFDALAGRRSMRPAPGRCPARPGPPRPGLIPSTPSRPS